MELFGYETPFIHFVEQFGYHSMEKVVGV